MISLDSIAFGDGKYTLALPLKWIVEIEQKCGARGDDGVLRPKSIYTIHAELEAGLGITPDETPAYLGGGAARPSDIREVLRCALIGGGFGMVAGEEVKVGPHKAVDLVDTYLPNPVTGWVEGQHLAWAILNATIRGPQLKKKAGPPAESPDPLSEDSSSPTADSSGSIGSE